MELTVKVRELAARLPKQLPLINTEEATKNALVLPFLSALGYDVFDPGEVTPELVADVGTKKGEKVDYAVLRDGKPLMLVECKQCNLDLAHCHASQLYRYFSVTSARIAILTNGVQYHFFTDLDAPNKMDSRPFLQVNLLSLDEQQIAQLKRFTKGQFEIEAILSSANDLKYTGEIKRVLAQELDRPSEELVRFFASRVYEGRMTKPVREQFTEITRKALQEFVSERVRSRLESALAGESPAPIETAEQQEAAAGEEEREGVTTTPEEMEGYQIVRAILSASIDPRRVAMRDVRTYCGILLDDNNRRPICRLHFEARQKHVGLFDEAKNETRHPIEDVTEIFGFADALRATVARYDGGPEQGGGEARGSEPSNASAES
jgi:hypothetical protein